MLFVISTSCLKYCPRMRIPVFAYLTFKITWDIYIVKGTWPCSWGFWVSHNVLKNCNFLPELSTHNTYPLHKIPILCPQLFFNNVLSIGQSVSHRHCKGSHSCLTSNLILCKIILNICILMHIQSWHHNCCEKQLNLVLSLSLSLAN